MKTNIAKPKQNGADVKIAMRCCRCEKPADIPMPVFNQDYKGASSTHGRYIPDPRGRMLCWDCYEGK